MWEKIKPRLRRKSLWVAVASLVFMILQAFGVSVVEEQYNEVVNAILGVLILAGIIEGNSPQAPAQPEDEQE
ncbi:hypothetical protein [Paludifilum halophilum]|uniref:Holin n=1 Tax=Paludifilum halophilum TaxID=1642702 RepID=A0A235B8D5_9BACL|nr:hypothetical protein [Paludifilum halophilum]OYD08554.1 hypothetical protein CHM34_06935 [Paludifilum halophilum]